MADHRHRISKESSGLLLLLLSAALFSLMGYFVQRSTNPVTDSSGGGAGGGGLPSTELVFIRAIFQGTLTVLAMSHLPASSNAEGVPGEPLLRRPLGGTGQVVSVVLARGAVGGFGFVVYYYTISALPLGDAVALMSLKSVVTVAAGWACLGEALKAAHLFAAAASTAGAVLIAKPTFLFWDEMLMRLPP